MGHGNMAAAFPTFERINKGISMTVTLNLPPQVEQAYLAEAQARGLPVEEVMQETLVTARRPYPVEAEAIKSRGVDAPFQRMGT